DNRPEFAEHVAMAEVPGRGPRRLLSIVTREQLPRVLRFMLDEQEFLSDHGVRSLSRVHRARPYVLDVDGVQSRVSYEPAGSRDSRRTHTGVTSSCSTSISTETRAQGSGRATRRAGPGSSRS